MRAIVENRLDELKKDTNGFNNGSFRWRNRTFNGVKIQDLEYENLTDENLLSFLEMIVRQYYKQG
jgi:hypothetical protein